MLLPRKWRNLALAMVTVTVLCNLLALKQMPDSSSRSIRAADVPDNTASVQQASRESISRKLGSSKGSSSSGGTGALKRWVLSGRVTSKQQTDSAGAVSGQQIADSNKGTAEASQQLGTSEELYNSHPRFGQQSQVARSTSNQAAKDTNLAEGEGKEPGEGAGSFADALVRNASIARPHNLVQLSEAFRQQQVQVAEAVKVSQIPSDNTAATQSPPIASETQSLPAELKRAPAIQDVLEGKAPVLTSPLLQPVKGLPAQNIQAYPGQVSAAQQQHLQEGPGGNAVGAEELGAFSSASEAGAAQGAAQDTAQVSLASRQQVLAEGGTKPRAPDEQGKEAAPALQQPAQNATVDATCFDEEAGCPAWAEGDGCIQTGPAFMLEKCRRSCGVCGIPYIHTTADKVTLNNGMEMPLVGFGTAGLGRDTKQAVKWALEAGYRLLDSAQAQEWYREDLVGQAIIESGIPREELFLTSKLHPRHHGYDSAMIQFTKSLSSLAVEYVDLFLLHYPACWPELCGADVAPAGRWQDSWKALETLVDKGLIRAIGVSNFDIDELAELLAMARIKPALVQRHSDPLSVDFASQALCRLAGVQYQGYSTLGSQWLKAEHMQNPVLENLIVQSIAQEVGRDAAQVVLKWALQHGQAVVPRSSKQERIAANRVLDFELSDSQMRRIDALDSIVTPEAV